MFETPQNQKAALYIRVSTEEQAVEGMSVSGQTETLRQYCSLFGIEIYRIYQDLGISGKDTINRPSLNQLIADSKKGLFNCVLVWKISRLSRSLKDLLILVDNFEKNGVSFISYTEKFDTSTPVGKMTLQILGSIAEFERNTIIENVKMGLKERVRQGNKVGGHIFGYKWVDRKIVPDEAEADAVKKIFDLYVKEEKSLNYIADYLNDNGYKTKRNVRFTHFSVGVILENPTYIGMVRHNTNLPNEYVLPGNHTPLIDEETFKTAQTRRESRSTMSKRRHEEGVFLLSGITHCPLCGGNFSGTYGVCKKYGKEYRYRYYKCINNMHKHNCDFKMIRADYIEDEAIDRIISLTEDTKILEKALKESEEENKADIKPLQKEFSQIDTKIAKLEKTKQNYFEMFENEDSPDKALFADRLKKINSDILNLNNRKNELISQIEAFSVETVNFTHVCDVLKTFKKLIAIADLHDKKKIFRSLVQEVKLTKDKGIEHVLLNFRSGKGFIKV